MCLFPEIFGNNSRTKYNRLNLWLASVEGVVVPNSRDLFSAGGQVIIEFNENKYIVPQIIFALCNSLSAIKSHLDDFDIDELCEYWEINIAPDRIMENWCDLVANNAKTITTFPLKDYIMTLSK